MGGCSIVVLFLLAWPALTIVLVLSWLGEVAAAWVRGPAFPFLVVGTACFLLATVDLARILWLRFRDPEGHPIERQSLVRPALLCAVTFVAYAVMIWLTGGQILSWFQAHPPVVASTP